MKPGARTHGVFTRDTRHVAGGNFEAKVTHRASSLREIEEITPERLREIGLEGLEEIYTKLERKIYGRLARVKAERKGRVSW